MNTEDSGNPWAPGGRISPIASTLGALTMVVGVAICASFLYGVVD